MPEAFRVKPCLPEKAHLFYGGSLKENAYLGNLRVALGSDGEGV